MPFLLDTNICIAAMRGRPEVIARMKSLTPADCMISTVTTFELLTGVAKCARPDAERGKVIALMQTVVELPFDASAALEAAKIRAELEAQGMTIGPYDLLLAGQARARGATMATANVAEFARVADLAVENWLAPLPSP